MYVLSVQYSCAVVSDFLFEGKANLVLLTLFYYTLLALTDGQTDRETNLLQPEKKDSVVCLADTRSLLRPEKKSSSRLSGGCAIVITTRKKKF